MVEFGEKIKQLREEKGMTQQSMADLLYVTRQAVSRWECGARYPDLLTAKKIAHILGVSVDELVSGEELKTNIEKESIFSERWENICQVILYTIAVIAYVLILAFGIYSLFPSESLAKTPAGNITIFDYIVVGGYLVNLIALLLGLVLALSNKLTAKTTGVIMSIPYLFVGINSGMLKAGMLGLLVATIVILCFWQEKRSYLWWLIEAISLISIVYTSYVYVILLRRTTELGFCVHTVHYLGRIGMAILLGYQAYIWNKKKIGAFKEQE